MMEYSRVAAGMQVAYVEMTNVSVTLVGNESTKVFCALFHDRQDGATFGRLIASEVRSSYARTTSTALYRISSEHIQRIPVNIPGLTLEKELQSDRSRPVYTHGMASAVCKDIVCVRCTVVGATRMCTGFTAV